ncbi:MAG: VWA domain-containing protein, partial [Chloroflexales bacterium]|nr:VWA domain-containing protein [Chloroflexales bacterium]
GVEVRVIGATQLPTRLSDLAPFEGMVLLDVSATNLTLEQMTTVREFVRSDGRGLVAVGGRNSFTLGAYKGTPLEQVLPVSAEAPPRPERPDVALLLIIDHSASMGAASGVSKMDMAKEAAALAVESLRPEDRVGVLEFDTGQNWVVPFQQAGSGLELNQIQERIGAISLGGGTNIYDALNIGLAGLARQESSVRHAVLLTDGRSFTNDLNAYQNLMNLARQQNITLSSIAIGEDSDTELLNDLAQWGGGRYYFAGTVEDIPRLTLLESQIARSEPVVEGLFRPELALSHPLVRDFSPSQMPRLDGYVATTLKPDAELVLQSPEKDPLLATWQYGLGRAVAWTAGADAPWASQWPDWDEYDRFWAQLVRYTLPEPDSGPLQVRVTQQGDQATVRVDARGAGGAPIDLANTEATFTLPDGTQRAIQLRQVAPGRYEQVLALPSDGPYALSVRQEKDGSTRDALTGFVQAPPAEYAPQPNGQPLLEAIAQASGGQVLSGLLAPTPDDVPAAPPQQIWPWLLLAALLLWVAEIALRRGWLMMRNARA